MLKIESGKRQIPKVIGSIKQREIKIRREGIPLVLATRHWLQKLENEERERENV